MGLPASGKTTFIAALWHVVQANEITSALRLKRLDGDRTYLNQLRDAWLQCEPVPRTSQQGEKLVRMLLVDANEQEHELFLPDISGETFRRQWADREWEASYDRLVNEADGAVLFVHPDVSEPLSLSLVGQLAAAVNGTTPGPATPSSSAQPTAWDPHDSPTQVQLVALLQVLLRKRPELRWPLAVVVSAWDEAAVLGKSPERWCAERLPLLGQFLRANHERLGVRYYGVSAQGGRLPADAAKLKAMTLASKRIEVVTADLPNSHDITLPIRQLSESAR
jgi:hypothetical protein